MPTPTRRWHDAAPRATAPPSARCSSSSGQRCTARCTACSGRNRQLEDLLQDTFIAVFGSIASFRGESSLRTWIDTIAVRVSYRHLSRREPRFQHLQAVADLPAGHPDPEREAAARAAARRLYALLDQVEAKHRIAYTLHVIDGRPMKDVARVTGASLLAVKNRVWRARAQVDELARRDPLLTEFLDSDEAAR